MSDVKDFYWTVTHKDIQTKITLTYGFQYAKALQEYLTIASVITSALGGKPKRGKGKKSEPQPANFGTLTEAQSALSRVLGGNQNGRRPG